MAGFVTLAINNLNEKRRARRDFVTKAFEGPRDDIKRAVDASLVYYPHSACDRTKAMEAQLLAAEREVRHSLTAVLALQEKCDSAVYHDAQTAFDDFIAVLTSGSFQTKDAEEDLMTVILIADAGAKLRSALIGLRSETLSSAVANDWLSQAQQALSGVRRSFGK